MAVFYAIAGIAVLEDARQDFSRCSLAMESPLIDYTGREQLAVTLRSILPESVALRRAGGLNRLLAGVRRGKQLVKLPITMKTSQ